MNLGVEYQNILTKIYRRWQSYVMELIAVVAAKLKNIF